MFKESWKGKLALGLSACLLSLGAVANAGSAAAGSTVGAPFGGTPQEWDSISHDGIDLGNEMLQLKAVQKDGKLFLYAKGNGLAGGGTFYIDSDNDPTTGESTGLWADSGGIDYKLSGAGLFAFGQGAWIPAGTAEASASDGFAEAAIQLSALGLTGTSAVKVGFLRDGIHALPEIGSFMMNAIAASPSNGGDRTIEVDGDTADWADIAETARSDDGSTSLKAYVGANRLNVLVEGRIDSNEFADGLWEHVLIDADKNPATGASSWAWANKLGSEYLVQFGLLYASGADGGWSWTDTGTPFPYARSGTGDGKVIEWSLPLADLGIESASSIRLGFLSNTLTAPGASGDPATVSLSDTDAPIVIDGQDADWSGIEVGAAPSGVQTELYAVQDDRKLYTLVKGKNLDLSNVYYIDADNKARTGDDAGADYKVDRGTLYKFKAKGKPWTNIGPVYSRVTTETAEMYVYLDQLDRSRPGPMKLSYESRSALRLPAAGQPPMSISRAIAHPDAPNAYYPRETFDAFANPYMGWMPWAKDKGKPAGETYAQPHSLVYAGISWRELEPQRGVFDWSGIEAKYQFAFWANQGKKINLRIVLDTPTADPSHKDIPDWLYDELAAEGGPGTWYDTPEIGSGFSPDYNSETLIAEHERMIAAVAAKYDGDPRIAFVQLGSLGHWGEWHTWPAGSGAFPLLNTSDRYAQAYLDHFSNKKLGMRKPFPIAAANAFGLFNDVFGIKSSTNEFIGWTKNGWTGIGEFVDPGDDPAAMLEASKMPEYWRTSFSGGEFAEGNPEKWLTDEAVMESLRQARESHTSWLGPSAPGDVPAGSPLQSNLDAMLKTMGYRFVLESVAHDKKVAQGEALNVSFVWNNKGVAPFYFDWPLAVALADKKGKIAFTALADADIRQWQPGRTEAAAVLLVPAELKKGEYTVLVALIDPDTGRPGIRLAIGGQRADGWYELDEVDVEKSKKDK